MVLVCPIIRMIDGVSARPLMWALPNNGRPYDPIWLGKSLTGVSGHLSQHFYFIYLSIAAGFST